MNRKSAFYVKKSVYVQGAGLIMSKLILSVQLSRNDTVTPFTVPFSSTTFCGQQLTS